MRHLNSFKIFEAKNVTAEDWAGAWQELPEWKLLLLMGFEIYDTNKNGTLTIYSSYSGVKLRLTSAGYVRTSSQGYVYQDNGKDPMPRMLGYVISRFIKKGILGISIDALDAFMKANPDMIKYLMELPKVRDGVLSRTGISDTLGEFYKKYGLTPSIVKWLDKSTGKNWTINESTGKIDVALHFSSMDANKLGFRGVKFGEVYGDFEIGDLGLTSLEGSPEKVGGSFRIYSNSKLTSLKGGPLKVGGNFMCVESDLFSLEGSPLKVEGDFTIRPVPASLFGAPLEIGGEFKLSERSWKEFRIEWNLEGWIEGLKKYPVLFAPFIVDKVSDFDLDDKYLTPEVMFLIRKNSPEAFASISKKIGNDQASTIADLGELGF
jgi:hypothetical protein